MTWEAEVGDQTNPNTNIVFAGFAALFLLGASSALPDQAQARVPTQQTYPVTSSQTSFARDAETFDGDRRLDAACRKSGQGKAVCLCVTHIMKYELTLSEYRAAIRLYGQSENRRAIYKILKQEGVQPADIKTAEEMERVLPREYNFAERCAEAKTYYKTSVK